MRHGRTALAFALAAVAVALAVSGCSRQPAKSPSAGSPTAATTTPKSPEATGEPTSTGSVKVGPADAAGRRSYTDAVSGFAVAFPQAWSASPSAGAYPGVAFKTAEPAGKVSGVTVQFVDNPEKFTPDAILRNKWRSAKTAELTSATVGGTTIDEARVQTASKRGKPIYIYEAVRSLPGKLVIVHVEGSDAQAVDEVAVQARETLLSAELTK